MLKCVAFICLSVFVFFFLASTKNRRRGFVRWTMWLNLFTVYCSFQEYLELSVPVDQYSPNYPGHAELHPAPPARTLCSPHDAGAEEPCLPKVPRRTPMALPSRNASALYSPPFRLTMTPPPPPPTHTLTHATPSPIPPTPASPISTEIVLLKCTASAALKRWLCGAAVWG